MHAMMRPTEATKWPMRAMMRPAETTSWPVMPTAEASQPLPTPPAEATEPLPMTYAEPALPPPISRAVATAMGLHLHELELIRAWVVAVTGWRVVPA